MSNTKKITISALMVALGTAIMSLAIVAQDFLDLSACAIASVVVVFVYIEIGSYFPWLVWICTTLTTALLLPNSLMWAEYFTVFGLYPLIKAYIERLPRWSWLIVKLVYINTVIGLLVLLSHFIVPELLEDSPIMLLVTYILMNVAFVAYDYFIVIMARFYIIKLRPKIKKLLK